MYTVVVVLAQKSGMHVVRVLLILLAWRARQQTVSSKPLRRKAADLEMDAPQLKRPPRIFKTDIQESLQWRMENSAGKRQAREEVLFVHKPTPAPTYYTAKHKTSKRCSDDFDCMRVLGQVCNIEKQGSTGTCQCPDSTPVHVVEHDQPRCVSARLIFEDCADTAECAFLNPYVECVNQICTCSPPNVMKRKDLCIPASNTTSQAANVFAILLMSIGAIGGIVALVARIIIGKEGRHQDSDEEPHGSYRRQRHTDDPPMVLLSKGIKRIFNDCKDKIQDMVLRKPVLSPQMQSLIEIRPTRPTRTSHESTVVVDVHVPYEPLDFEDIASLESDLRRATRLLSQETSPTTANTSLRATTSHRAKISEKSVEPLQQTSPVTTPNMATSMDSQRQAGDVVVPHIEHAEVNADPPSPKHGDDEKRRDFNLNADLEHIMRIVIDQLSNPQSSPAGLRRIEGDERRVEVDAGTFSDTVRAVYSRTLLKLRQKLHTMAAQEAPSVDQVSFGDPCRSSSAIPRNKTVELLPSLDKGCGEAKGKTYADVSTLCRILTPHSVSKDPRKRIRISDTFSEHRVGRNFPEPPVYGVPRLQTHQSTPATIDAFPVTQTPDRLPKRCYLLRDERQDNAATESFHSCSDPNRFMRQRKFIPTTTLPISDSAKLVLEPISSDVDLHNPPRDSLKAYLAGKVPTVATADCPSVNDSLQNNGEVDRTQPGVGGFTKMVHPRVHYIDSDNALQVREETSLCTIPKKLLKMPPKIVLSPIEDEVAGLEVEEETPLLNLRTVTKKKRNKSILLPPYSRKKADLQDRTQDSSFSLSRLELGSDMPNASMTRLLNRSRTSIHGWGRKAALQKVDACDRTPVEESTILCSSGPSSEVKEYAHSFHVTEIRTGTAAAYVDPTSSSPPSDIQSPALFLLNAPRQDMACSKVEEIVEKNLQTVASSAILNDATPKLPPRQKACEEVKLTITENDIIQCLNRVVGPNRAIAVEDNRKFPEAKATQEAVCGYDLMQDVLLNEDVLSTSDISKVDIHPKGNSTAPKADLEAFSQPLSRLRRGDLKNILKEILEEEYAHVLQLATHGVQSIQSTTAPPVPFEHENLPALTHEPLTKTSRENSGTSTGKTLIAPESPSTNSVKPECEFTTARSSGEANTADGFDLQPSSGTRKTSSFSKDSPGQTTTTATTADNTVTQETSSISTRRFYTELSFPEVGIDSMPIHGADGDGPGSETSSSEDTTTVAIATTETTEDSLDQGGHVHLEEKEMTKFLSQVTVVNSSESNIGSNDCRKTRRSVDTRFPFSPRKRRPSEDHRDQDTKTMSWVPPIPKLLLKEYRKNVLKNAAGVQQMTPEVTPSQHHTREGAIGNIVPVEETTSSPPDGNTARSVEPLREGYRDAESTYANYTSTGVAVVRFSPASGSKTDDSREGGQRDRKSGTINAKRTRPKSASFHGILPSDRLGSVDGERALVPRSKSYTEYWLKTVSLYKEVSTCQISPSTDSSGDIMETESMAHVLHGLHDTRQGATLEEIDLENFIRENQMNPLLKTFLYMHNTAYQTSVTRDTPKSTTYVSYDLQGTPISSNFPQPYEPNEIIPKTDSPTSLEIKQPNIETDRKKSSSLQPSADYRIIPAPPMCDSTSEATVILECDRGRRFYDAERQSEIFSPNTATTIAEQASFEDSSSSGPPKSLKKTLRKTAPYRTPFPLCSSSRSSAVAPISLRMLRRTNSTEYMTSSMTQGRSRIGHSVEEEKPLKKCVSALSYLEKNRLWKPDSLPFQQWLNAARRASLRPGDGGTVLDESGRPSSQDMITSSESSEEEEMHSLASTTMQSYTNEEGTEDEEIF
ncbi:uncharacterized protein LOC135396207 isoform X2 [Ornithodoros turicata]|uniref:uncharacterized protein LOC135376647 isoform X2 n=1 Tax=Ornithodoros turicata TaxID=34597 RepID=UPI003139BA59